MMAAKMNTCTAIDTGTVYQAFEPTLIEGLTTSPNMSRGTRFPSYPVQHERQREER